MVYNGRGGGFEGVGAYNAAVYGNINSIVYFNIYKQNTCQKPRTLKLKTAERISRLKKFHGAALNFTFKIHITLNSYSDLYLKNSFFKKSIFKTLGINPGELTVRNSEAR